MMLSEDLDAKMVGSPGSYGARRRVTKDFHKESLVKEEFQKDSDINEIMRKWSVTGVLQSSTVANMRFGDFGNVADYHGALSQITAAEQDFAMLPAEVRDRFGNDVSSLLVALENPEREEELRELGLIEAVDARESDDPVEPAPGVQAPAEALEEPPTAPEAPAQ